MLFTPSVLVLASLAAVAVTAAAPPASPIVVREPNLSLSFVRRVKASKNTILEYDRARAAQHLAQGKSRSAGEQPGTGQMDSANVTEKVVTYVASVGVGDPPTVYLLIPDTGSSNTWLGAHKPYNRTSTSHATGDLVYVSYGSGSFVGAEYYDTVTFTENVFITNQSIGVAKLAKGFEGVDGILGIGPTALTKETTFPNDSSVPTVTDNLFTQGKISEKVLGIFFAPVTSESEANGELTFGGIDRSKCTGDVVFTPITKTSPSSRFFGIDQTITYGSTGTTVLPLTAGITDTGTTLLLLATDAYNTYVRLTGATVDSTTGLLKISIEDYAKLESLFFQIGETTFEFTKNAQTWPRSLNSLIGGSTGSIYLIIGDLGDIGEKGLDFINGMAFLERFYSVFDSTNNRVGFATTARTYDTSN